MMANHQEFPENRPRDMNNAAVPSVGQMNEEAIKEARISREQAEITQGFNNQPTAGHHRGRERSRREDG